MIKKFIKKIIFPNNYSSEAYIKYLKSKGCKVGDNTYFFNPRTIEVDVSRPEFIEIGNNCKITRGVIILAHDYSYSILFKTHNEVLPTSGITKIGNNVFIGMNSIILMNTTIGDNVIIGAGSVVKGSIPSNTIFAGNPAKQISTINEYYAKLKNNVVQNATLHARRILQIKGRYPTLNEMGYYTWLFTENTNNSNCTNSLPFYGNCKDELIP
ncbi:hypothetical protein Q604_UNBC18619G0006, partial [human gut metagenome]